MYNFSHSTLQGDPNYKCFCGEVCMVGERVGVKAGFNSGKKFLVCGKFLSVAHNGLLAERPCCFSTPMQLQHRVGDWEQAHEQSNLPPSRTVDTDSNELDTSFPEDETSPTNDVADEAKATSKCQPEEVFNADSSIDALNDSLEEAAAVVPQSPSDVTSESDAGTDTKDETRENCVLPYPDMVFDDFDANCLCKDEPAAKMTVTYQSGLEGRAVWVCAATDNRCSLKLFIVDRKTKHAVFYNTAKAKAAEKKYLEDLTAGVTRCRSLMELKAVNAKPLKPKPFKVVNSTKSSKPSKRCPERDVSDGIPKKLGRPQNRGTTDVEEDQWRSIPSIRQKQFRDLAKPIRVYTFGAIFKITCIFNEIS